MKNKIIISFIICFMLLIVTGCDKKDSRSEINSNSIDNSLYQTTGFETYKCTRDAEGQSNEKIKIKYELYYDKNTKNLEVLKSYEKIESSDSDILKQYSDAYKKIYKVYDGLKYYDNKITTTSNSVTSITYINYGKININKLMNIEGTKDNVKVTNGKVKVNDWKSFAKKYGTTCE